jgi:LacI family transcriptional regulator
MSVPERGAARATLRDVAQLAGVSLATASKALNGRDQVHPDTRARVVRAAEQIAFTPNALARGLIGGQTGTVGLLAGDLDGRFSLPILMGAEDAFGAGRISVFLCDARGDAIREQYHLTALLGRQVDGLLVVGSSTNPRSSLGSLPVPVVYAYAPSDDPDDTSIVSDNVQGGAISAAHLTSMGRRRIAHLGGAADFTASSDRVRGIETELARHGLSLVGGPRYRDWTEQWGRDGTRRLLEEHPDIDGIICGNDQIARGSLEVLREEGREVPREIAVMGFDNWEVFTTGARPQLTSVDMNLEEIGRVAARRLFEEMGGAVSSGIECLPCRVVAREST